MKSPTLPTIFMLNLLMGLLLVAAWGCEQSPSEQLNKPTPSNASISSSDRPTESTQSNSQSADGEVDATGTGILANAEDWSSFLGPRGDGTSAETGLSPADWNPHPRILWSKTLGVSYGAPTIQGNRLYQFDRYDESERITCMDVTDGSEQWRWEYPVAYDDSYGYNNGPRCSPIVDEDRIYLFGVAGQLSCVSSQTQSAVWTKNLNAEYGVVPNFFGVASNPYVYGDLLLVMVGGSPIESRSLPQSQLERVKPDGNAIVAFNKFTGEVVYEVGDDLASYSSPTVRTLAYRGQSREVGMAFVRNGLLLWEPDTGKQLGWFDWRADMLESVNAALPVTDGSRVLVSEAYDVGSVLLDFGGSTPTAIWKDAKARIRDTSFRAHWSTPVLIDGYLYGCSGRNQPDCDFRCIDFNTGEVMWTFWRHERPSVLLVDGYLIALGELGTLKLLKPTPEKVVELKSVDLNELDVRLPGQTGPVRFGAPPCWAAPVVAGGKMWIRSNDRLTCFELIPSTR